MADVLETDVVEEAGGVSVESSPRPGWDARVQRAWAERPVRERMKVLRRWRHGMAGRAEALCTAIAAEARTEAEVRVTEILPLLAAGGFLEKHAEKILAPRVVGRRGLPVWLAGVRSEVWRVALGRVLVIGPANYPLFLPGVQVLQALAAGNAVTWKPGRGGKAVAELFAAEMVEAGLPPELLRVTEETAGAGRAAIAEGVDKVFFTGSGAVGRDVLRALAETGTPSVMELSGCSSVVVLPSAELGRVAAAVAFGMRLNGGATCMAPRRLVVVGNGTARREALVARLRRELAGVRAVRLPAGVRAELREMVAEARADGAAVLGEVAASSHEEQGPVLIVGATPGMRVARTDVFAPVLSVIDVADSEGAVASERACPFGLTVAIFGEERAARRLAARMVVGAVTINDLIVPTADPRVPFGGRKGSGFGVTRGREGLLEMTAVKTMQVRRGGGMRQYAETGAHQAEMFEGMIAASHAGSWRERWRGLRQVLGAGRTMQMAERAGSGREKHGGN